MSRVRLGAEVDRNVALIWVRSGDTATPLVRHQPPHNPRNLVLKAEGFT
jgi:hypothetical protein